MELGKIERTLFLRHRTGGLNLVVVGIVLWNTVSLERAVAAIRQPGRSFPARHFLTSHPSSGSTSTIN